MMFGICLCRDWWAWERSLREKAVVVRCVLFVVSRLLSAAYLRRSRGRKGCRVLGPGVDRVLVTASGCRGFGKGWLSRTRVV